MARPVRRFREGSKRKTSWSSTVPETTFTSLAASTAIIDSTFVVSGDQPETLIRTRGQLLVTTDQQAAAENPFGAFGIAIVSNEAVAVGVTAVPLPYTDSESDLWLLHQFFAAPMRFVTSGMAVTAQRYDLDSKAMRIVSPDQTVVLVMEVATGSGVGIQYRLDARLLSKGF